MKIGLLTYHYTVSYGATLQTYATCKALQMLGHEVEIIDYRISQKDSLLYRFAFLPKELSTKRLWRKIYPQVSSFYPDEESLRKGAINYDAIIVGSDQTWNPDISGVKCLSFFLNFGQPSVKRLSYASSFGFSSWPSKYKHLIPQIKQYLSRFNAISIREETGKRILKEIFGVDSEIVVDPTLLINDFSELSGTIVPNHRFVAFIMNRSKQQLKRVIELGNVIGQKPVMTSTIYPYKGFIYQYPPSVGKWLRNIGGADFVVVDSFHALVFCLKFKKQFAVITPDNGLNTRLTNLLRLVNLENRFFYDDDLNIPYDRLVSERIDYKNVDIALNKEIERSLEFLKGALR